ncbi:MAG: hypothetical protein N3B12_05215 [Armatimonadetes bacterium]|nr:hypothetical protein [Armatimonadota bacterium]
MKKQALVPAALIMVFLAAGGVLAWTVETNLTPGAAGASRPALATGPDGRIHCVYPVQASGGQLNLVYRVWNGLSWSSPYDLPGPNYKEPECDIAVGSDNRVHIVGIYRVDGTTNTPYTVYYWEYNGSTWSGPTMLSPGTGSDRDSCTRPCVAVDRFNNVHVVWSQGNMVGGAADIIYRKRQAGVWQPRKNVSSNPTAHAYGSVSPDLAVDRFGNTVHIVWHDDSIDDTTFQVWYTKNTNLGDPNAWLPSDQWFMISTQIYGKSPRIVLDRNDYPNVFWIDKFGGSSNVQGYRRWNGTSWTAPQNWGSEWFQDGAFDSRNVLCYLYAQGSTQELYYRTYDYNSFSAPELVSAGANTSKVDYGAVALSTNRPPVAVWEERKTSVPANIYYSVRGTCGAPGPVQSLSAVALDSQVRLSWINPSGSNFSGTMIRFKTTGYPSGPADGALVCDRSAPPGSSDQFTHSGLVNGVTHYYAAFAHDDCGNFSAPTYVSATPRVVTCAYAKRLPDGSSLELIAKRVTAIFSADGCFYVEEPNRTSGLRVVGSSAGLTIGDVVNISGSMSTRFVSGVASERQLNATSITRVSGGIPLKPVAMGCLAVGGAAVPPYVPGVVDANGKPGVGTNTMGLLVKIAGKVTRAIPTVYGLTTAV